MAGIPPLTIYTKSYPRQTSIPHGGPSNPVLSSPVDRELCQFFQELNESSSLGLTGSELVSLAKGNFDPSPSNFRVQGPRRIPSSLTHFELLAAVPSGLNCGTIGLNSIPPAAGRPHLDQAPPRACKSSDKERPTTAERTLRLHTFSTAARRKGQCDGKNPKSVSCCHESFPQSGVSTNENAIGRTTSNSKSKSSGSGHESKCDSSSEASFQCRVIKLTQREHMILQHYEKMTKSMDKLNKVAAAKKSVQLYLLTRSQEVHISGKDSEFARTNLLKLIRLSQVWWDKRRRKEATAKLTSPNFSNSNLQERLQKKMSVISKLPPTKHGPNPYNYSMTGASVVTSSAVEVVSKNTSVGGIFQLFPHLCANFPDCSNKSPSMKISKNCMEVQIKPEFLHSLFIEGDQKFDIVHKISSTLVAQNMTNVKVCLLRKSPAFHVLSEDGKFLQQAIKYLCSLMRRCGKLDESSSLGVIGSELVSLVKGNFVPSAANFCVQGPRRIPPRLPDVELLAAYPSGLNCDNIGLNSILPVTGRPHLDIAPPRACKSSDKARPTTTDRTLRLHTFSTAAGLKGQCGGKNPKSLSCSHISFPKYDSSMNKNSIGQTSSSQSKSSGSGQRSKCHSSSEGDSFQCRVIKLAQREHMVLQGYEKRTKSIHKFNKVSAVKKNVQLFLLTRPSEVHVCGKDFEYARTNLLSFIRLSQVWWDERRRKRATAKLTSLLAMQLSHLNLRGLKGEPVNVTLVKEVVMTAPPKVGSKRKNSRRMSSSSESESYSGPSPRKRRKLEIIKSEVAVDSVEVFEVGTFDQERKINGARLLEKTVMPTASVPCTPCSVSLTKLTADCTPRSSSSGRRRNLRRERNVHEPIRPASRSSGKRVAL